MSLILHRAGLALRCRSTAAPKPAPWATLRPGNARPRRARYVAHTGSTECRATGRSSVTGQKKSVLRAVGDAAFIAGLFAVWYMSNIYFNIYNKQVLLTFPHPVLCTWIHLLVSSALAGLLWVLRLKKAPTLSSRVIDIVFPLSILHLVGFYSTNASLGAVAVSLTHTIKSMEPFFTVVFSWMLMGIKPAKRVLFSLVPIVLGVCVASATDLSFNWAGFNAAMVSNLAFQSRNVLSKKAMLRTSLDSLEGGSPDTGVLDEVNIFSLMSIGACIVMLPCVYAFDQGAVIANGVAPGNWMSPDLWHKCLLAGVCRFGDVLASFLILQKVVPVTHSVGNCVKRVVVIAASIVVFQTAASVTNIIGTGLALSGVLLYSFAKRSKPDKMDIDKAIRTTSFEDFVNKASPGTLYERAFAPKAAPAKKADDSEPEYYL